MMCALVSLSRTAARMQQGILDPHLAYEVDVHGRTPLHAALQFRKFNDGIVETLLRTAPGTALLRDADGNTPLHCAALWPTSRRAVSMLMHVAPTTMMQPNRAGKTPLDLALESNHAHADCFLSVQDPARCLASLVKSGLGRTLVPHYLRTCPLPLPAHCWDMVPRNMPGLAAAIPEVLTRGTRGDFGRLAKLLNSDERRQLAVLQQVLGPAAPSMPLDLVQYLTSLVFDFDVYTPAAAEAFDLPVCHFHQEELN